MSNNMVQFNLHSLRLNGDIVSAFTKEVVMKKITINDLKQKSIRYIKGVGESRESLFKKLDIHNFLIS